MDLPGPAADAARSFSLAAPPPGFVADPYPWYAALRRHSPVHALGHDSVLLTHRTRIAIGALLARYPRLARRGSPRRDLRLRFRGLRELPVSLG